MKKYLLFFIPIVVVFIIILISSNKVLVCKKTSYEVGGELIEKLIFKGKSKNIKEGIAEKKYLTFDDDFTEEYYNYLVNNKECFDIKRNDNILEFKCNIDDYDTFEDVKEKLEYELYECTYGGEK